MRSMILLTLVLATSTAAWSGDWRIEPGPTWRVEGHIVEPNDVSGIAALANDEGMLVSDETRLSQYFKLDRAAKMLVIGDAVTLVPGKGKELDLEAITASTDGKWFYATGSHGISRKTGLTKPERSHVFCITAGSNRPSIVNATLMPFIESDTKLRDSIGKTSEQNGLDIEGIVESDGRLFFGLRSPSAIDQAYVIEVNTNDLFANPAQASHHTYELALGEGQGIRELARVSDGFLLISGNAGNHKSTETYALHHWQGPNGKLTKVGTIPQTKGRAEGLLVLDESATQLTVLIVFDSIPNGGPMELRLLKP